MTPNSECGIRNAELKPITGSAEIQIGWTALVEAVSNHWLGCGMSAEEINIYVGVPTRHFLKVGWLREEKRAAGHLFWPAGQLLDELKREPELVGRDSVEPSQDPARGIDQGSTESHPTDGNAIHVRTFPFPHVVPTTSERSTASEDQSGSLRDEAGVACAEAASEFNDAATGTPSTAVRRGGRWDANPVGADQGSTESRPTGVTKELAEVIGVLKVSADSVRERLTEITMEQQDAGWPDRTQVYNAVAHLRRLASDLFNELADYELKSKLNLQLRKGGVR
jgi:hypothetical protein